MPQTIGNTPENQITALPLYTAAAAVAAVDADTITIVGNRTFKRWSPSATGINGNTGNAADPRTPAAGVYLLTNWLDFTSMVFFTLAMGIHYPVGFAIQNWIAVVIPAAVQDGSAAIEPVAFPPGPDNRNLTGSYTPNAYGQVGNLNFAQTTNPAPTNASAVCCWRVGGLSGGAGILAGVMGPCRILFKSTTGVDPVNIFLIVYASS